MRELQTLVSGAARLLRFAVKHSLRDMGRNRARTAFALVCVATGVSAIVALRSLAFMVGDELTTNLAQVNRGDIRVYATRSVPELIELSPQDFPVFTQRTVSLVRAWAAREDVVVSFARLSGALPLRPVVGGEERTAQTVLSLYVETAVYPYYDTIVLREPAGVVLRNIFAQHGEASGALDDPRPIVISTGLTRSVGMGLGLGDIVRLGAAEVYYVVRGIAPSTAETVLTLPAAAFLGTYVYLPLEDLTPAGEAPLPDEIFVKVPLGRDIDGVETSLIAYLQEQIRAETDLERELSRATVPELAERNAETADVIDDLILVIGLSSLLIGGIGIVNTMLVVVNRRMLEIAVLKTLGLKAYRVTLLFLVEALLLGAAGSAIGVGVGVALSYLVRGVGEEAFALTLEWRLYPAAMGSGLFLGVLVTALFGFMPTLIAGQVRPATVLRPNEAEMPAAGLIQTLLTLLVMIAVLGVLVSSIVGGAFAVGPVIMIAGGGALVGLFAGVIAANRRRSAPARGQRRLRHWLGAGAWHAVQLYGALAVGAALASGVLLIVGAIWRPFGLGDADLPDTIMQAAREGESGWALGWALLTAVVARAVWRHAGRAARAIALAALGLTLGGALGAGGGLVLERLAGGTGLWRSLVSVSTGIVLVEGTIALLSAIYVGYWLLVWGVARLRPVAMSGITSGLLVGLTAGLGAVASLAGRAALTGTLALIVAGWLTVRARRTTPTPEPGAQGDKLLPDVTRTHALYREADPARYLSAVLLGAAAVVGSLLGADMAGGDAVWLSALVVFAVFCAWWLLLARSYSADGRLILREMAGRRTRVALTLLGLSVGVAGLSLVSLTAGAVSHLLEIQLGEAVEGNLLIGDPSAAHRQEVAATLDAAEGVLSYSQVTTYRGVLVAHNGEEVRLGRHFDEGEDSSQGDENERSGRGVSLGIIERETLSDMPRYKMVSGRALAPGDEGQHRIMLRESFITEHLGIRAGDRLQLLFENQPGEDDDVLMQFQVIGVISRQSEQTGLEELGNLSVLPPGVLPTSVTAAGTATIALIDESDNRFMDQVLVALADVPGVIVFELDVLTQLAQNLLDQLNAIPTLVAWLALVAGTAIIANTVALATQERRRTIAVMKAMGLKGWRALAMLLVENGLIGLLAGLIGTGVGLLVTVVVVLAGPSPGDLQRTIEFETMGWLVLMSVVVAIGVAMLSAWTAIREQPLNVLRYE